MKCERDIGFSVVAFEDEVAIWLVIVDDHLELSQPLADSKQRQTLVLQAVRN